MAKWIAKLQQRWKVKNAFQVVIILLVFACTGITVAVIKRPVLRFFDAENNLGVSIAYYLLILPAYNVLLLIYGFVFGQFRFFYEFEKRFFTRIFSRRNENHNNTHE